MEQASQFLYEVIANKLIESIDHGTYPPGTRLPSVRQLSQQWNVSMSTAVEAYRQLENLGRIEVRAKSGHFVKHQKSNPTLPMKELPRMKPSSVQITDIIMMTFRDAQNPNYVQLGAGIPCPDLLPIDKLRRAVSSVARRHPEKGVMYLFPPGDERLRKEIAKRSIDSGCTVHPDDIVITSGCLESVTLCLQATCKAGDIVAIESPSYYGFLQIIETLGLKALEIPNSYPEGLSLEALRFALENHHIKACLFIPNFNNPLGTLMSDQRKRELVKLMAEYEIPLIEDDIFADLSHERTRPTSLKAFDQQGLVLQCSSFSKSLAPGYRTGWVLPGRFKDDIQRIKTCTSGATSSLMQMAIAEFLSDGDYGAHIRKLRLTYQQQTAWLINAVKHYFPQDTVIYPPKGGYLVWMEIPGVNSVELYEKALERNITIMPGALFSTKNTYQHYIRLNAAYASPKIEKYIAFLGKTAHDISKI